MWGTDATSSLVPTQAATDSRGTDGSPKRRSNHAAAAPISAGLPAEAGYPRSVPDEDSASMTPGGGSSHGVPMEQSTTPPGNAWASLPSAATRS
jgi:hypothetical protein